MDPNHRIFDLDFVPPTRETLIKPESKQKVTINQKVLEFAQNAPRKRGCKGLRVPISKEEREEAILQNLERQAAKINARKAAILREKNQRK